MIMDAIFNNTLQNRIIEHLNLEKDQVKISRKDALDFYQDATLELDTWNEE